MNQKSNKLTVPDLISVGVFTALYFVLVTVATFACALLPGVGNILLPAVAALISGSVYMLLAAKLQKFGGITIMGLVIGLFFFVSGHFVLSFAANIICGVAADLVAAAGKYRSKKLLLASYVVFSYGLTGPILPLWFMKSAYIANLTARGARTPPTSTRCLHPSTVAALWSACWQFWFAPLWAASSARRC